MRGEAALCGFTVHLCPLNPHEYVEVVKCHQLGRGEGGRTRKAPTKGGHCLGRGSGGSAGEPAECPSPPAPTAQVPMKRQLYPPEPFVGGDADPQHPGPWSKPAPREAGGAGGEHRVPQPPEPASGCQGCSPPSSLPFPLPGKPDLRGQTGRSHSGSRSSPASPPRPSSPFQGLLWPLPQAGRWVPARQGEGTLVGLPGDALKGAHPLQSLALGPSVEQQRLWGHCILYTSRFTLCLLPCTEADQELVPNIWQGCGKLHSGVIVAQKAPFPVMEQG